MRACVQEIGTPYTRADGPVGPLNDRRPVVCSSVSNYGLACLASGCSDFNPFAARCAHTPPNIYSRRWYFFICLVGRIVSARDPTMVTLPEARICGERRPIQLAVLSKRIIKLMHRDLTMFSAGSSSGKRRVIDTKVICRLRTSQFRLSHGLKLDRGQNCNQVI